jgi:hypothetical protein
MLNLYALFRHHAHNSPRLPKDTVEIRGYLRLQDPSGNACLWPQTDGGSQTLSFDNMHSQQVKGARK